MEQIEKLIPIQLTGQNMNDENYLDIEEESRQKDYIKNYRQKLKQSIEKQEHGDFHYFAVKKLQENILDQKYELKIDIDYARKIFSEYAYNLMPKFSLDDDNHNALDQLFMYFLRHEGFNGDLAKGLFLFGQVGSGKTISLEIFKLFADFLKIYAKGYYFLDFEIIKCTKIFSNYQNQKTGGEQSLAPYKSPKRFCFDDLGRELEEQQTAMFYGGRTNPLKNILDERYSLFQKSRTKTFITTNMPLDNSNYWISNYSDFIYDRMKEMFNPIFFKGKSRRK